MKMLMSSGMPGMRVVRVGPNGIEEELGGEKETPSNEESKEEPKETAESSDQ